MGKIKRFRLSESQKFIVAGAGLMLMLFGLVVAENKSTEELYQWNRSTELTQASERTGAAETTPTESQVIALLDAVIDPELGVSIVDLGLIYEVAVVKGVVKIVMTLTSPACPLGKSILEDVREMLFSDSSVENVDLVLTFSPAWTTDNMSESAKNHLLGLHTDAILSQGGENHD